MTFPAPIINAIHFESTGIILPIDAIAIIVVMILNITVFDKYHLVINYLTVYLLLKALL